MTPGGTGQGPGLERIEATLVAINSADDKRNPSEPGLLERAIEGIPNGRLLLEAGTDTIGCGTTEFARLWKDELARLLASAPRLDRHAAVTH